MEQAKIIILGEPLAGKTSLIRRFINQKYINKYVSTIGVDVSRKNLVSPICETEFLIWDGRWGDFTKSQRLSHFNGTNGVLVLIDSTRNNNIQISRLQTHLDELNQVMGAKIPKILIISKIDSNDNFNPDIYYDFIKKNNLLDCIPVSALRNINIEACFHKMKEILDVEKKQAWLYQQNLEFIEKLDKDFQNWDSKTLE